MTNSHFVKMESNVQEFILKKFVKIENVTTGNVIRGILDLVDSSERMVSVSLAMVADTATECQKKLKKAIRKLNLLRK